MHGAPSQIMTSQNGRAFNEWLRAQLKAKKMSQRQLAQQSGVDHSTISRLIRGDRMPSLGTATKLARGLRELRDDADTPQYLGLVAAGASNPTARVEYALRADELLTEAQVRQIMEYYLAVRMRRFGRAFQPSEPTDRSPDRPTSHGQAGRGPVGRGPVSHGQAGNGPTAMTPRLGTAGAMTGTIRPMAATVRQTPATRPVSGQARSMTPLPRATGRPVGREPRY
jgi:transcriptional regulator with XRE-family HTH domain